MPWEQKYCPSSCDFYFSSSLNCSQHMIFQESSCPPNAFLSLLMVVRTTSSATRFMIRNLHSNVFSCHSRLTNDSDKENLCKNGSANWSERFNRETRLAVHSSSTFSGPFCSVYKFRYQTNFISRIILFPSCSLLQIDPRRKPQCRDSHSIYFLGQAVHGILILYATPKVNIMWMAFRALKVVLTVFNS